MYKKLLSALLGLILLLVCLEGALALGQWSFVRYQDHNVVADPEDGRPEYRVLAVGESTTAVAGNDDNTMLGPNNSYPTQLQRILQDQHPDVRVIVQNNGMMGGTSTVAVDRLKPALESFQPHIVIAMMGIKDEVNQADAGVRGTTFLNLRVVQLYRWLTLSLKLHRERVPSNVDSVSELPESARIKLSQQRKYIKETRLVSSPNQEASDDLELAIFLWFIQRHERAKAILQRTIEEHDLGYNVLAHVYATNDEHEKAIEMLASTIETHPDEGMYHVTLIELLTQMGRYKEAGEALQTAKQQHRSFMEPSLVAPHIWLAAARLAVEEGDGKRALETIQHLKRLISSRKLDEQELPEIFPRVQLRVRLQHGRALALVGDYEEAETVFRRALERFPRRMDIMWALAKVYRHLGRYDDEADIRRSLISKTPRAGDYFELAKLFHLSGNDAQIPELFDEMTERFPSLKRSHETLYSLCQAANATVVIMQYPSFGPETVARYAPPAPGVFHIDNEHVFDANPDGYFYEPDYPHSFSHYTKDGARVLAEHVATAITDIRKISAK